MDGTSGTLTAPDLDLNMEVIITDAAAADDDDDEDEMKGIHPKYLRNEYL